MHSNKYSKNGFNTLRITAFALCLAKLSGVWADKSNQDAYPLGVFNFDFARLGPDERSRVSELESIGYGGLTLSRGKPAPTVSCRIPFNKISLFKIFVSLRASLWLSKLPFDCLFKNLRMQDSGYDFFETSRLIPKNIL